MISFRGAVDLLVCTNEKKKKEKNPVRFVCLQKCTQQLGLHGECSKRKSTHKYHVAGSENEDKNSTIPLLNQCT